MLKKKKAKEAAKKKAETPVNITNENVIKTKKAGDIEVQDALVK